MANDLPKNVNEKLKKYYMGLQHQTERCMKEMNLIKSLLEQYPDLQATFDRWATKRFKSKSVNKIVDKFYTKYTHGRYSSTFLYIFPYVTTKNVEIFANPEEFCIGQTDISNISNSDEITGLSLFEKMRNENINVELIKKVELFIKDAFKKDV